jgi:hypothetical protein
LVKDAEVQQSVKNGTMTLQGDPQVLGESVVFAISLPFQT